MRIKVHTLRIFIYFPFYTLTFYTITVMIAIAIYVFALIRFMYNVRRYISKLETYDRTRPHEISNETLRKRRRVVFFHSLYILARPPVSQNRFRHIYVFPRANSDVPSRQLGDAHTLLTKRSRWYSTCVRNFCLLSTYLSLLRLFD